MAERPLYTLYKNLKAQNYDVPDDYNKFESALTRDGKGGADNRHAIYENLKAQNFDVPSTYERFYSALFEPRSRTSSRAKGGSVPMSAADRARFSAGAAVISASAQQTMNNAGRYNRLKQRKQKQQKDFGRVNLGTHQTPYGGDANNVVKDDFAYNPETGKTGAYVTSDNENVYSLPEAEQMQAILDKQNDAYQVAVDTGEIPSAFDVRDKNGNYDLQENIGKNGTYLTEEGAQKQFDKKLADAYARKKEIEALIAEDNRQHGNPLLSYGASIGASNGRTAEQSDYRNKLATSLSLVTEQIGALEAVKQYPTSSWVEDALKALDNTAFTAKTWDFGLTDFAIMGQMERIKTKMDNNIPLSGSDKMLLKSKLGADAATALEDEKMGNVYRWTKIAGQSLPFMDDFFLTGGYGGITKGISRGALKFAAKRGMGKVSAAILKNTGIVAGDVIGSYAMAGTEQALKTGADIMQRHLGNLYQDEKGDYKFGTFDENGNLLHEGGESIGTALYKGMTSAMVENYTEKLFGHNYGIKKGAVNFMEKHGMNASAEFFKNIGKSGWYTNSKKWMEKFGINGFAEEVMEEEIGIPLHALLDGEGKVSDLLDAKQQLDIIGGMAISVGSMYAMGAGSRPAKGIYNRAQYYRFRNKVNVADIDAQNLMGDNWADIKDKIDNATNEQMGSVLADILRKRDTMTKEQINAAVNYGVNLMKMRGYNIAKTAEMNAKEITNEPTTPEEQHQSDIDNAYSEGHDADDADKHDIQIQQEDQMKTLAAALGISEQQLSVMSDEELESLTGQDDKLDQAIYDYQLSYARYKGVVDDAQDKVDLAAHQAEQRVDMYTDQSRGSVRNATIKASGGLEDYGVYIISGNIATHDDGSIDVSNSDDMILYFDPTTNSVEHADAFMFAELGEELPADDVKAQAVYDAKENAIKKVAGIIDGTVEVGSQFNVTDTDGTEHTYEVLADYGDGTAAISIDGNVVENPYSLADLQQMKDLEDQKRLEAAKAEREQMEKERAAQQTQETQPSFDFNQILNDNGNVVLADVLGKDGNTKYPNSQLFLIRDSGAKAKVVELKSDGTLVPHAVNKKDVRTATTMTLDEYKQAFADSSMIEDNSGEESDEDSQLANLGLPKGSEIWMSGDGFGRPKENTLSKVVGIDEQGSIVLEDKDGKKWSASFDYINNHRELPPLDENANIVNEENNQSESNAEENTPAPEQTPAITLEDGTIVPMLEDGNPDFSKLTAEQTAELYDSQFGEDADSIVSGYVSDAKKALDKASNMTVKGKTFVEQKAAKDAKEKAIADAQAAYDSAIAIRDAYNERQLAKVEDTAEGRKELIEKARRKFARLKSAVKDDAEAVSQLYRETIGSLLHRLYDGTGIDVTDTTPLTAEEYVASNLGAHSLNYEGTETSKGVKQETGLSREDFAKTQLLAADGKGTTIDALVHSLWENRPSNLESLDTQDIRNALIGVLNSGFKASEARNFVENIRIAQAENILEEQKRAQENAAYAEQQKAEQEAELKAMSDEKAEQEAKSEAKLDNDLSNESNDLSNESDNEKINDNINDKINTPELSNEQQKAKEDGEKLGFPAVDNEGEPINQYVIELANWAKEQGLEIDPTSKWNNYADLFIMCKDGFGVGTLVPDRGESINQVVYFPDNVQDFDQLWKLHEEFNVGRDLKHSADMDNEQTQGAMFYDGDTAREFKEYVDKKVKEQNKVFGEQRSEEDLPFSAKENGKQQTTAERAADVEKNKVDDMKVVDNIVGQKTRKAFERLAKMMGANIQWQYSDKLGNGWIQETKDADGNVHRTIFITLDSSITEGAQFIFGHEMTHQIKNLNPAAYNELTQLVLDTYGSDAFDKAVDETMQRYSDAGFSGRARDYYAEEVVADAVGEMIRDLNLAHTLAMKMSHPLLAAIHEILQKIKLAFYGTEYSDVTKNIIRSIEQAYVKTANGEVTNSETGEDVLFSLRQKPEPKKKGIGYKVFVLKDGKLYPPMVANPDGAATPVGVWLDADAAPIAGESKTGRPQVKQGGKGTQGGSGKLAYRPGWHLGVVPYAIQFNRKDAEGNKTLFPKNFVFAEVEYAADVDYQEEARQEGINPSGKYQHSLAGLKHLPTDGYYMYRTNPNPDTDPWVITGAMKVNRILTRAEQAELVKNAGREPQQIQEGDIVTDDVVNSINQEIADAPKFSLKVYHGSGADFTEFDFDLSQTEGSAAKIDNSSETAKENGEKFSLKDEKTLAGVHNISEEKLLKAIKQGGLANPSVAVIDSSRQDHKAYGGISLILPSDKIAKRTGKNAGTWQGDAYTPTYPEVEKQMSNKGAEKSSSDVLSVPKEMQHEVRNGIDRWLNGGDANSGLKYLFLHEKGVAPEPKMIQPKFSDEAYNELKFITAGDFNIYGIGKADAQKVLDMYIEAKFDGDKDLYEEKTKAWLERNKSIVDAGAKGGMRYAIAKENVELYDEYGFNYKGVQTFVRDVEYDHRKSGVDTNATLNEVEDYIKTNNLTDEFNTWLEGKEKEYGIKEVIFDGFTPSGNRRYVPNTLENVSKLMKKQGRNGATGAAVSFQNFAARLMPSYGTLKDIRSKKGLLTSDREKFDKFREKWSNVFFELGMKCQPYATGTFDDYGLARLSEAAMTSDPQAYLKKEYNVDFSDEDTKRLKEMVKAIKEEHPAMYFETKFERPVRFDEFSAAVVPTTTKKEVKEALKNAGVSIFEYDEKSDADRKRAFNEAINSSDNTRFSLRYDQFEHDLNQWKKDNNLPKDAQRPTIPQRNAGESAVDFLRRVDEYRKQMALWKTAPTYEQHLLSDDTALGEFNRELQRGSVLKRIAFQDSMLAIRKAQEAIMKEVGVDRLNMAEDAYTAENRSHGKGKNEFEEYNNEFLQPLRKAYHQMKKILGDSYDNVRIYMMAKHGLERDAQMAFKKSLDADFEDVAQRSAAYRAYKGDMNRIINDSDLEFGRVDFTTWRQRDNALRVKYSPSYMDYRYDKNGIAYDYSGLSALFGGSDFEEAAHKLVRDIESKHVAEVHDLWDATNAATKKILRDGYKAGMMSKDTYQYVRDMYSHYIPLRGWDGTTADQVWDYIGGGKGAFNQTLKKAHGRTSIADDPIAYIENMAESGILLNNKNWVKQHLMLLAQNHPTSLLTLSKAWYVKSVDDNGNEEWIPATPQITSQMNSNQVKAAIDAFEKKMEQMAQTGDATQKRDGLNIAYPQTHSEEREHEVRVMKDGEEYVIYVNGDPQLAQAMNNTRAHRVREIQSGKLDRAAAWLGRKMAAAYTSLSPLFIPSNYFRDLTMTLASTAIREDGRYNYLLRKNLATSWNLGFMLRDYQNGKLREKVSNGNATPKERMFYDFMMNGGETGFVSSLDVEDLKKKFKNDLKDLDRWKANPVKVGHTIMDGIEFLNRAIEDSNRFAVYMTSIQYGRSIDEAVNDAKDVTLNFNRKGTGEYGWQMVRNLYLFINPAVQSLQTLGALAKHHPFKFTAVTASWLASGVLVPIVNVALMSLLGGDDDKDKYWQFTKWDRRNNLIMWVPFTHEYIKIPLAQEFRAFYGIGDMIASKMMGGELAEESWSQYAEDLLGQVVDMLPLDPTGYDGNIAVSLMPNAIRPVFELAFNVDFTGKPLFKETEYNKYDPNFTKAYVGTPDWLVRISRMVNSIGNDYPDVQQNSIDAFGDPRYNLNNPAVVDHVLSSYLGGAYTMGSQVLGVLTKSLNDPKEIKVADIPLFSKFVSNPDDRPVTKKQGDEFWDMKENHDRAANTLSKLKKQAKVDGDYSMLERFYGSEEYKQYKQDDVKVKKYEEDKKKERAEESGEEYRPHKLNADDIYKAHATPKDDFEDLKLKQLYTKLNGFKSAYDLLVDTAPSQSNGYYNTNKAAIDAIDEISLDKQEISELKKGFLDDGKDAYNAEDMKQIRDLRKKILSVLEKANKVVVANQKAKAEK